MREIIMKKITVEYQRSEIDNQITTNNKNDEESKEKEC